MKLGPGLLAGVFGVYFLVVAVGAWLTANGTGGAWFAAEASYWSYAMFLLTFLIVLVLAPILGAIRRGANPSGSPTRALAGPALVAALFAGIAASMLPASGGFLQANFKLNTALILMMAWSWIGLAFYWAASSSVAMRS